MQGDFGRPPIRSVLGGCGSSGAGERWREECPLTTHLRTLAGGCYFAGMARLFLLVFTLLISTPQSALSARPNTPRILFATHDPERRLPHTGIRKLGTVRVRSASYAIYFLSFVNPVTRHGQQRLAIIRNGTEFAGAYQCMLGRGFGKLVIGKDRLTVISDGFPSVIRFDARGPTHNRYFCGEGSGWEDAI